MPPKKPKPPFKRKLIVTPAEVIRGQRRIAEAQEKQPKIITLKKGLTLPIHSASVKGDKIRVKRHWKKFEL